MPIIYKLKAKLRRGESLASSLGMYESDANAQRTPIASLKGSEFQSQLQMLRYQTFRLILPSANHPHSDYRQYSTGATPVETAKLDSSGISLPTQKFTGRGSYGGNSLILTTPISIHLQ
jgi:hypothetical protein